MHHHGTLKRYTAALLNLFNDLEVQYKNSNGETITRNIPIRYTNREKSSILDEYTTKQLLDGNYNVLPRASLFMSSIQKADMRTTNKNVKVNTKANENTFDFLYNSVPYEITFELNVLCRGMNEACMIIEQVGCRFNPIIYVDIFDADNLNEATRVPVSLLDIGMENVEYEELSNNLITVSFGLSIKGNLYPPIRSIERIKEFKMFLNEQKENEYTKKSVLSWDVNENGELNNGDIFIPEIGDKYPRIIEIHGSNIIVGDNDLMVIWEDPDSTINELTFEWDILSGDASIIGDKDNAILSIHSVGEVEVQVKITDYNGNFTSGSKKFYI